MDNIKIFNYNGNEITFSNKNEVMVNATEMAKPFGKRPAKWLELPSTKEFLSALTDVRKSDFALIQTDKGGINGGGGTWMHEDVALEFARWLSPAFAIWCNDRIRELLTQGVATVNDDDATILHAIQVLQKRIEDKQRELKLAQSTITLQNSLLDEQAPKVAFANAIEASKSSCLVGELAKIITQNGYEIGQNRLFEWLRNNGYLGTKGERYNIPNQKYIEQGLFDLKKGIRSGNDGVMHTTMTTKVTMKGCRYFINKFVKNVRLNR